MSRSVTSWYRLEPRSEALEPGPALEARVHDPAWFLGRQWQLGELTGEDAGSPAWLRLRVATAPITRVRAGAEGPAQLLPLAAALEALVEAEPVEESLDWLTAAEAGAHFLAQLAAAGLAALGEAFAAAYPLPVTEPVATSRRERSQLRLLRRRAFDGSALRRAVRAAAAATGETLALPPEPAVPPAQESALRAALARWLGWYPAPAAGAATAWHAERLEYRFALGGPAPVPPTGGASELVLEAPGYRGGRLDWHDLRVAAGEELGAAHDAAPSHIVRSCLPTPVTYPGMPASRWWELEDARVWFGGIESEAGDTARMLLAEFATIYGNDWFLAPLDLETGVLAQIEALVVRDTFGQAMLIRPTASAPGASAAGPWRMFHVSGAPAEMLLVLPVPHVLEGAAIEEVALVRDEMANLAWAIERRVVGPAGDAIDRHERWRKRVAAEASTAEGQADALLRYRLSSDVPDHWIPLVPRSDGPRSIRLDRGTLVGGDGLARPPEGRLLEPERALSFFEEEIPRSGVVVTRSWQLARTASGASHAWIGRRVRPGRGEASSGLAFDELRR